MQLFLNYFQWIIMREVAHIKLWAIKVDRCLLLLRLFITLNTGLFFLLLDDLLQIKECLMCQVGLINGLADVIG